MNLEKLEEEAYGSDVFGQKLHPCCTALQTGFYKDGYCRTDKFDSNVHVVCAHVTKDYLAFAKSQGEDLTQPNTNYDFPGLKQGDKWCLCVNKWKAALENNVAPPVFLNATNEKALRYVSLETLQKHASSAKREF